MKTENEIIKAKIEKYLSKELDSERADVIEAFDFSPTAYKFRLKFNAHFISVYDLVNKLNCRIGLIDFEKKEVNFFINKNIIDSIEL